MHFKQKIVVVWREYVSELNEPRNDLPNRKEKKQYLTVYWYNGTPLYRRDTEKSCDQLRWSECWR